MLSLVAEDGVCEETGDGPVGQTGICLFGMGDEVLFRLNAGVSPVGGGVACRSVCCCTTTVAMFKDASIRRVSRVLCISGDGLYPGL